MNGPPHSPGPPPLWRAPRRGLGVRASLLVASAVGLAVIGSAWLKTRHIEALARRTQWQPPNFELVRPGFDRAAFEASALSGADGAHPAGSPVLDPRAHGDFLAAMEAYQRGDDRQALRALQRTLTREPRWAAARFYRGACELLAGHPMAATADLQAARDLGFTPPDGPCDWWLGVAHFYNGDWVAGRRCIAAVAATPAPQAPQARGILQRLDTLAP